MNLRFCKYLTKTIDFVTNLSLTKKFHLNTDYIFFLIYNIPENRLKMDSKSLIEVCRMRIFCRFNLSKIQTKK